MSEIFVSLKTKALSVDHDKNQIAFLTLDRPEKANCFNDEVISQFIHHFESLAKNPAIRLLVIDSAGKHFSAGADLNWMKDAKNLSYEENIEDSKKLQKMFQLLKDLPFVTLAIAKGAVYGGALGLLACADIVAASHKTKFCLSEVKLGLLPAVILPFLADKMLLSQLKTYSFTAEVFDGQKALESGLVDKIFLDDQLMTESNKLINQLLVGGPNAQQELKNLFRHLNENDKNISSSTVNAIAKARVGSEGQLGLGHFFDKKPAPWVVEI